MGRYLEEAIISLRHQSYENIEHVVIDGESTDNTRTILSKYESEFNLRWVSEKDRSVVEAINKGFKMARGEIQYVLYADDLCLPWAIQTAVNAFERHRDAQLVYGDCVSAPLVGRYGVLFFNPPIDRIRNHFAALGFADPSIFMREGVPRALGGFDEAWDSIAAYDFFARALKSFKWARVDEALGFWRYHAANRSATLAGEATRALSDYRARYFPEETRFSKGTLYGLGWGRMETAQLLRLLNSALSQDDRARPWANLVDSGSVQPQMVMREVVITYTPFLGYKCHKVAVAHGEGYIEADDLAAAILKKEVRRPSR